MGERTMRHANLAEWCKWAYENCPEYKQMTDDLAAVSISPLDRSSCVIEKVDGHYQYVDEVDDDQA